MKYNFSVVKSTYVNDYGVKEKIRQETLACLQIYLTHSIASPESYFVLAEKLAKTVERIQPGLRCSGIALDYAFTNPLGDYGTETIIYSIA